MSAYAQPKPSDVPRVPWWLVLIEGIAAILLGLLLFASPVTTTAFLVQFLGIYWLAKGLFYIISIFIDRSMWGWKLLSGIVGIIAGVLILQHPLWSTLIVPNVLVYIVAFSGLFMGLVGLIQAFRGAGWGAGVLGVLSIIFGLILLFNPILATLSVPWVLGLLGIAGGIMAIFGAFGLRKLQKEIPMQAPAAATPGVQTRAGVIAPAPVTPAPAVETEVVAASGAAVGVVAAAAAAVEPEPGPVAQPEMPALAAEPEIPEPVAEPEMPALVAEPEAAPPEPEAAMPAAVMAAEAATREADVSFAVPTEAPLAEQEVQETEAPAELAGSKFLDDIEYVEGIGPAFGQKLKAGGIFTPKDLLERGASPKGREEIAEATGISHKLVLEWVNHCDLFRIRGIGSEYADLLEAAGVDTVVELAARNPANLYLRIIDVNAEKDLVRRVPVQSMVEDWVAQAKLLPRVITY